MAVNYGIGTENAGGATFGSFGNKLTQSLNIAVSGTYYPIGVSEQIIGTGDYTNHNVKGYTGVPLAVPNGVMYIFNTGMYLISYTVTISGAANDNVGFQLLKNNSIDLFATTSSYSRGGDMFETGASCIAYIENGDYIQILVANLSDTSNITVNNANVSIARIGKAN